MHILKTLPFNLAQAGPADIDGVSNYYIQIFGTAPSPITMATLYFIDSHGQIPSEVHNPDYKPIQSNQMAWFTETSQTLRKAREKHHNPKHVSLAFQHIPLSEFADASLITVAGHRREPTEGPSVNTHFYTTMSTTSADCCPESMKAPSGHGCATEAAAASVDTCLMARTDTTGEPESGSSMRRPEALRRGSVSSMLVSESMSMCSLWVARWFHHEYVG